MDSKMSRIVNTLAKYLKEKENLTISEDTLRYLFYASVLEKNGILENTAENCKYCFNTNVLFNIEQEVKLFDERINNGKEMAHINPSELDTLLKLGKHYYAIEFKRHFSSLKGDPKFIGLLVNDFARLKNMNNKIIKFQITLVDNNFINNYHMNDKEGNKLVEKLFNYEKIFTIYRDKLKKINNDSFKKGATKTYDFKNIPNEYEIKKKIIKLNDEYSLFIYSL